jgi:hypothetical protein
MPMNGTYGLLARFETADDLVAAAGAVHRAGFTCTEAFAPYPLPEAARALGYHRSGVSFIVLLGGLLGAVLGFFMLYWTSAYGYPLNAGGRPLDSWPVFIPITFELGVLTASLAAFLGVFVLCGLPRYHHPLFAAPLFARATTDGFYLCIEADDPQFDLFATRAFLTELNPVDIEEVAA